MCTRACASAGNVLLSRVQAQAMSNFGTSGCLPATALAQMARELVPLTALECQLQQLVSGLSRLRQRICPRWRCTGKLRVPLCTRQWHLSSIRVSHGALRMLCLCTLVRRASIFAAGSCQQQLQIFQHGPDERRLGSVRYHSGFLRQVIRAQCCAAGNRRRTN